MPTLTIYDKHSDSIDVQLPDDTLNFWDANPQGHGGLFADFEDTMVSCVVTVPPHDMPQDYCDGDHLVTRKYGYYDDMITHTDGKSVATGTLKDEINASGRSDSLVQAGIDGHLPGHIAWACYRYHTRHENFVSDEEYADTLINTYDVPEGCL